MLGAMWKPFEYLVFYQDVVLPTVLKKKSLQILYFTQTNLKQWFCLSHTTLPVLILNYIEMQSLQTTLQCNHRSNGHINLMQVKF